jgi:hypothetical protein|tara:strand:- start:8 stop:730 length:723 start_codon:yes stop_codon:yes gene_type:complete
MVKYVVPSYKRPYIFRDNTLAFLFKHGVKTEDIYVFVRDDDPLQDYYLKSCNIIKCSEKGIGRTHNYITEYFDEDEFIVEIDDDLQELYDNERKPVEDFISIVEDMKSRMTEEGISYGGTYQVNNPMFMSGCQHYTTDLRYLLGCVRFRFVRKDIVLETNYAEDFENAILHFLRDGKILKNNFIAPKTKNYQDGGCKDDGRDIDTEKIDKEFLANKYPELATIFQRKNGHYDLRLKKRKC